VDRLDGDEESKRRLRIVLATLLGELTVTEACERLGVSESRFHEMRRQALEGALESLRPGVPGRPKGVDEDPVSERLEGLERENRELRIELQAAYVRTELALGMPQVLTAKGRAQIKKNARAARRAVAERSADGGHGT
jgi:transposase-like protein